MRKAPWTTAFALLHAATILGQPQRLSPDELPDPGTTRLEDSSIVIRMNLDSGRPMVDLKVNGEGPYAFVVDTGASFSLIDESIARDLGLEIVGSQSIRSPGASEEIKGRRVRAARVETGGLRIESPVLATMDLVGFSAGTIEGVLGRPHFAELLLTFDYPESRLVVEKGVLDATDPATIAVDTSAGSVRFPIDVAGVSVPVVLDTGSPGGFTLPKRLEAELPFRSAPRPGPTIQLVGGAHPTWRGRLEGAISLGALRFPSPEVVLTTIAEEFGNIGFNVLRELQVTLDQASGLVRLERGAARPEPKTPTRPGGPRTMGGAAGQPRLGVAFAMTSSGFVKERGGLVIQHVDPGGAADEAGLTIGDIVLSVGGTSVASLDRATEIAGLLRAPRPLELEILRGERRLKIVID